MELELAMARQGQGGMKQAVKRQESKANAQKMTSPTAGEEGACSSPSPSVMVHSRGTDADVMVKPRLYIAPSCTPSPSSPSSSLK